MLGEVLRDARVAAGLTQEELADQAGVHRTYVSLVERDVQSPTVRTLVKLCAILGVRASEILWEAERRETGSS